ncbi:MAG: DUF4382 domain-containing protein [Armatimonadota bacterium]|nr:DUF4382 domain-containing protein [Armatimonadota bacterium]
MSTKTLVAIVCTVIGAMAIAMLPGCGGGSGSDVGSPDGGSAATGTMQVLLTDMPAADVQEVWVNIAEIQLVPADDGEVVVLDESLLTNLLGPVDLLTLADATLELGEADVPVGTYQQIRLVLYPDGNKIVLPDDAEHELTVPSGAQSGVKVNLASDALEIVEGSTTTLLLDFMAAPSVHRAGHSGMWIMRPVINATAMGGEAPHLRHVRGTVRNRAGQPVEGSSGTPMAVILEGDNGRQIAHVDGQDGSFEIPSVLPGEYQLAVGPVDQDGELAGPPFPLVVGNQGQGPVSVEVTVTADDPVSVNVTADVP